jgi:hypothetical protein
MGIPQDIIDDLVRLHIEALRNRYFHLLLWCTFAVLVGVVMEEVERIPFRKTRLDLETGIFVPRYRLIFTIRGIKHFGVTLLIIGILGELVFEWPMVMVEDGLTEFDEITLADARHAASQANKRASEANERTSVNEKHTTILQGDVAAANKRVEKLREANNRAAAELEAEKAKRLELAASLLPRNFRDQSGALAMLAGSRSRPVIFEYLDDREVTSMAEQVNFVAFQLGWKSLRIRKHEKFLEDGIKISPGSGLPPRLTSDTSGNEQIRQREKELPVTTALCWVLVKALQDSGLDAEFKEAPFSLPPDTILIMVGPKPNHAVEEAIKELAKPPSATSFRGLKMEGNRMPIPEAPSDPSQSP